MDWGWNNIMLDQGCRTLQEAVIDEYSVMVEWQPTERQQNTERLEKNLLHYHLIHQKSVLRSGKIKPESPDLEAAIVFILQTCDLIHQYCFSPLPHPPL